MKSDINIVESLNSFIKHQFIKRNAEEKNFEERSIQVEKIKRKFLYQIYI